LKSETSFWESHTWSNHYDENYILNWIRNILHTKIINEAKEVIKGNIFLY
jgi:hypothetical protein